MLGKPSQGAILQPRDKLEQGKQPLWWAFLLSVAACITNANYIPPKLFAQEGLQVPSGDLPPAGSDW